MGRVLTPPCPTPLGPFHLPPQPVIDGDIYVPDPLALGLGPIYDCPPYGNF